MPQGRSTAATRRLQLPVGSQSPDREVSSQIRHVSLHSPSQRTTHTVARFQCGSAGRPAPRSHSLSLPWPASIPLPCSQCSTSKACLQSKEHYAAALRCCAAARTSLDLCAGSSLVAPASCGLEFVSVVLVRWCAAGCARPCTLWCGFLPCGCSTGRLLCHLAATNTAWPSDFNGVASHLVVLASRVPCCA